MPRPATRRFAVWLPGTVVVGLLAMSAACTDSVPDATPATRPQSPPSDTQPTPTLGRQGDDVGIPAEISPNIATVGQGVVVTPVAGVDRTCGVTIAFYDPYLWGDRELIGLLLGSGEWVPFDSNVTTTLPPCLPPPVSDPVDARVPDELADGLYRACIGAVGSPGGCGLLRVVRPGDISPGAADAAATPLVVAPGGEFTLTPATDDATVCSRYELHAGSDAGLELVGFPTPDGEVFFDVPGATTTAPRCDATSGAAMTPITFVVPDVPAGAYVFCLASRFEPNGCARVTVDR